MKGLLSRFQTFTFLPDWALVKQAKLGNKEAFGKLYEKYLDRLYRYIFYKLGQQKEITEDIVQTVFIKAWENLDKFQKGSFQAWLYTIARNTVIDHIRVYKNHAQLEDSVQDEKMHVETSVINKLQIEEIMGQLKKLTDEQQEVIMMRFVNDMTHKEIAQALGKKEDAIRALQYRGMQELKRRMLDERE